jgi:hypothetical protein
MIVLPVFFVSARDRPNFGFRYGFGAESGYISSFGLVSVSAETA